MSRIAFLVSILLVSLFPQAVLADQSCVRQALAERHGIAPADVDLVETSVEPLYIELASSLSVGDLVRFEIRAEGLPLLTEQVRLTEAPLVVEVDGVTLPVSTPVIELLASHSTRLEMLRRAAAEGAVEISIFHGESQLGSFDLAELDRRSTELLSSVGVSPFGLRSTVSEAAARVEKNSQCEYYCDDEQDSCYLDRCGQFGSASCYDACDREYIDCLETCGICQPSSSTTVSEQVVSTTPTSTVLCTRSFFNWSVTGYQRAMDRQIKRTETTTTVNSDCSETVTTSVSYYNIICWQWLNYNTCPYVKVENPAANC